MYKIYCGSDCLYDQSSEDTRTLVVNPTWSQEDNSAGSLSFTIYPHNSGYDTVEPFTSIIRLYKDGTEVFRGRPVTVETDFYNNKAVACEGALNFLRDVIYPGGKSHWIQGNLDKYIQTLISFYNSRADAGKTFKIGHIELTGVYEKRTTGFISVFDILSRVMNRHNAHMRVRYLNGDMYIDVLKGYVQNNSQKIEFAKNMLDFSRTFDFSDLASVILPVGAPIYDTNEQGEQIGDDPIDYVNISSVNGGSLYVENTSLVTQYGRVEAVQSFDEITDPDQLLEEAQNWLTDYQFDGLSMEVSVLDMSLIDGNIDSIKLLDLVRCVSSYHGMDRYFPVTKIEIKLDDPAGTKITLNKEKNDDLSGILSGFQGQIGEEIEDTVLKNGLTVLQRAKIRATDLINSATGGYVTMVRDETGEYVKEIVISNTPDWTKASRYWRWNENGLGYFVRDSWGNVRDMGVALTMNGEIVADMITTGVMSADRILGGTLRLGNYNNKSGWIYMYDDSGQPTGWWGPYGINAIGSITAGRIQSDGGKALALSGGRLTGYYDGEEQGWLDTSLTFKKTHEDGTEEMLGRGWLMSGKTAIAFFTPRLCTATLPFGDDIPGVSTRWYHTGESGKINVLTNVYIEDGELKYETKELTFINGLLNTDLGGWEEPTREIDYISPSIYEFQPGKMLNPRMGGDDYGGGLDYWGSHSSKGWDLTFFGRCYPFYSADDSDAQPLVLDPETGKYRFPAGIKNNAERINPTVSGVKPAIPTETAGFDGYLPGLFWLPYDCLRWVTADSTRTLYFAAVWYTMHHNLATDADHFNVHIRGPVPCCSDAYKIQCIDDSISSHNKRCSFITSVLEYERTAKALDDNLIRLASAPTLSIYTPQKVLPEVNRYVGTVLILNPRTINDGYGESVGQLSAGIAHAVCEGTQTVNGRAMPEKITLYSMYRNPATDCYYTLMPFPKRDKAINPTNGLASITNYTDSSEDYYYEYLEARVTSATTSLADPPYGIDIKNTAEVERIKSLYKPAVYIGSYDDLSAFVKDMLAGRTGSGSPTPQAELEARYRDKIINLSRDNPLNSYTAKYYQDGEPIHEYKIKGKDGI